MLDISLRDYEIMVSLVAVYREEADKFVNSGTRDEIAKMLRIYHAATGLAGEAGEVANKAKKIFRDNGGVVDEEIRQKILGELGGVAWYLTALGEEFDFTLRDILEYNYDQITSRQERGVLKGDGDDR